MQMTRLSSADFDKMIIESIDEVIAYDRATDEMLFMFDQIISGEITSEFETVYAEGRQGIQLAAFDRNKTAGFNCENGYVQAGAIAAQLGTAVEKGGTITYEVTEAFELKKGETTAKLNQLPALEETSVEDGGETTTVSVPKVKYVYILSTDGSKKATYKIGDTASANDKTFTATYTAEVNGEDTTPAFVTVAIPSDLTEDGSVKILVQYDAETTVGQKIINAGDKYSNNVRLVINFVAQEPCGGNKYLMQCEMPNAKVSGNFSLSVGDSPSVQNFEATALLDACSINKTLFEIKMV